MSNQDVEVSSTPPFRPPLEIIQDEEDFVRASRPTMTHWIVELCRQMDWICAGTIVMTMLAAVGLGIVVWLVSGEEGNTPNRHGRQDERAEMLEEYLEFLIQILSDRQVPGLQDPTSPAFEALEWMAFEDEMLEDTGIIFQRYAVVLFFFATAGPEFWDQSWLRPGVSECHFDGLACNDHGEISRLELHQKQLVGEIPEQLSWLTSLEHVDCSLNRLQGTLPASLFLSWSQLTHLGLSFNHISGWLPPDWSHLQSLENMDLQGNLFSGPLPIALPPRLNALSLKYNMITGTLPFPWFEDMHPIQFLDLSDNAIPGPVPETLGQSWTELRALGLYHTLLTGTLPTEIGSITNLEKLSISGTLLTGTFPTQLVTMPNLQWLVASEVAFTGTLPTNWNAPQLEVLTLIHTQMEGGLPTTLGRLPNLEFLQLAISDFVGTIPSEIGNLSHLRALWLHENSLTGAVPSEICALPMVGHDIRVDCENGSPDQCSCCASCT